MILLGAVVIVVGLMIWKKQKTTLIWNYHKRYVREWDIPAFTKRIGVGFFIIGIGFIIGDILMWITGSILFCLISVIAFLIGGFRIVSAIMKYNNK